jgi:MipA family protein
MRRMIQQGLALIILELTAGTLAMRCALADEQEAQTPERRESPIILGAGAYTIPTYPGSRGVELRPFPAVDAVFWNRLFIRPSEGVGVYLWHEPGWDVGVSMDADQIHRYEADDTRLKGLGNVDKTARANVFVTRRCPWMEATLKLSTDIGGAGHGNVVDLELARPLTADTSVLMRHWGGSISPRLNIRAGFGTTWSNKQYMRSFFGVDSQQSARSGLPVFSADSGFSSARVFLSARYEIRPRWLVGGQVQVGRLLGDAADSPIAQKRSYAGGGLFLAYVLR